MRWTIAGVMGCLGASAALAQSTGIKPGLWETTTTITDAVIPGAPPGIAAMMKKPHTMRSCVTPAQAAQGPRDMLKRDASCQIGHYTIAGGVLDADITCHGMHMVMHGSFTPSSYSAQSRASSADGMKMTSTVSGRLLGPCS